LALFFGATGVFRPETAKIGFVWRAWVHLDRPGPNVGFADIAPTGGGLDLSDHEWEALWID
jgi:hypothetical protein